ncbi:hypothetical protein L1987_23104 [Smallanthus sonchifolius]|uniref:Uncharacterized protein n=1 Tax=Smallanthus sonchifolius TaxID=185202 RepID=A0ACB9IGP7_9ASTR|nr:hypothetical protein L1987_23104 [Smallanthus sonchifolius]
MSIVGYHDASSSTDDKVNTMYLSWQVKHGKFYNSLREKVKRFHIFKDNLRYIEQHNSRNSSYKLGLNKFADLSTHEYRLLYTGAKNIKSKLKFNNVKSDVHSSDIMPDFVDWRTKGAVAAVKDQGYCGELLVFKV